jgi:hypothetical protein
MTTTTTTITTTTTAADKVRFTLSAFLFSRFERF